LRRPCRLGRVPRGAWSNRLAYEVWNGRLWDRDISQAADVLDAGSSEMSLLSLPSGPALIYSPPFSTKIVMRRAPALTGPWGEAVVLYEAAGVPGAYYYGGKAHEITNDGHFIIATLNDNGPLEMHSSNPGLYWPQVLKLPLPPERPR